MTRFGYTLMSAQSGPRELVGYSGAAERAGFDFEVVSDHYFPWLAAQGHSPYAWSVLGAVAQVTDEVELMTYVTCPTMRYHPAVVAQKAATVGLLSGGRFILGLGAGESLNEHVVGQGWPHLNARHDMLGEAVEVIGALLAGGPPTPPRAADSVLSLFTPDLVDYEGEYFSVDSARLWDHPEPAVEIAVAVSGSQSVERFAPLADHLVAVEPSSDLLCAWDSARATAGGDGPSRKIGQIPVCWGPDRDRAVATAHDQFRWFAGGWHVNANLPTNVAFDAATKFVRPEDVAASIPCGPDTEAIVAAVEPYWEAGFTDIALVQVGDESQDRFVEFAGRELLPALRERAGRGIAAST
jgi:alkanesulfonate monooxygenase SsuD/methylene tetrahydromethanopterin reductase-like flavin-dependent oxidoreductase (luciferase family)